ncbi:unnamed protein product, partial [Symbiodinium sp. CCMP2592]
ATAVCCGHAFLNDLGPGDRVTDGSWILGTDDVWAGVIAVCPRMLWGTDEERVGIVMVGAWMLCGTVDVWVNVMLGGLAHGCSQKRTVSGWALEERTRFAWMLIIRAGPGKLWDTDDVCVDVFMLDSRMLWGTDEIRLDAHSIVRLSPRMLGATEEVQVDIITVTLMLGSSWERMRSAHAWPIVALQKGWDLGGRCHGLPMHVPKHVRNYQVSLCACFLLEAYEKG